MSGFVTPDTNAVIQAQDELIREFGGIAGLRDRGALESALQRPHQHAHYADGIGLPEFAAVAGLAIAKAHAFADGNKRIALAVLYATLDLNGWYLDTSDAEAERAIWTIAAGEWDLEAFTAWVAENAYAVADEAADAPA